MSLKLLINTKLILFRGIINEKFSATKRYIKLVEKRTKTQTGYDIVKLYMHARVPRDLSTPVAHLENVQLIMMYDSTRLVLYNFRLNFERRLATER